MKSIEQIIKSVVKDVKVKYPNYKFTIKKESYSCLLILDIKPVDKTETFAYYGGDSCGYVVNNRMYKTLYNEFKNNSDLQSLEVRVMDFVVNSKTMELEFK